MVKSQWLYLNGYISMVISQWLYLNSYILNGYISMVISLSGHPSVVSIVISSMVISQWLYPLVVIPQWLSLNG